VRTREQEGEAQRTKETKGSKNKEMGKRTRLKNKVQE
jgi:hypothetical protein